jgi:hypothetical protein
VKSFLGFAYRVGFMRFSAGPLIKLNKALRQVAQRILREVEIAMLSQGADDQVSSLRFAPAPSAPFFGGVEEPAEVLLEDDRRLPPCLQHEGARSANGPWPCVSPIDRVISRLMTVFPPIDTRVDSLVTEQGNAGRRLKPCPCGCSFRQAREPSVPKIKCTSLALPGEKAQSCG